MCKKYLTILLCSRNEVKNMAEWLAGRIELGKLNYNAVVAKYQEFKNDINSHLSIDNYIVNDDGTVTKN